MHYFPKITTLFITAVVALLSSRLVADETVYTSVDVNPVPIKTPPPEYPEALKRAGTTGVVSVSIVIDEKGKVSSAKVIKSTQPEFEAAALAAVKKWTFRPAKKDGAAVKVSVSIPIRFDLDD